MLQNKLNNPKTLTFLIIIIFIILGLIIFQTLDVKKETATLTYENNKVTFIVPRGYHFNETESLDNLLRYKNKKTEDLIIYSIEQTDKEKFEQTKKQIENEYKNLFNNIKLKEYKTTIENQTIKVLEVKYTPSNKKENKNTYIFYPLKNNYIAKITTNSANINKSNIKNYIKTK